MNPADETPDMPPGGLAAADRAVLELAARGDVDPGHMVNLIAELGMSEVGYYVRLDQLLDTRAALAAYPVAVNRLRRLREGRIRVMRGAAG